MDISKKSIIEHFNRIAVSGIPRIRRNRFYHRYLQHHYAFLVPPNSKVLEIGCGTGELLNAVKPSYGVGIDFADEMIKTATRRYPNLKFLTGDAVDPVTDEKFDYIILSDLLHILIDVQQVLHQVRKYSAKNTRVIISNYNFIWEPVLRFFEILGLKQKSPASNWLSHFDIFNLLEVEGFQVVKRERKLLLPKYIPVLNFLFNTLLVNLPFFRLFGLVNLIIARPQSCEKTDYSVSIIIPARNENGNIENAIKRVPDFGLKQQFVFIEGNSSDGTYDEMIRIKKKYGQKSIVVKKQTGKGKGNAVREGFELAEGEVLMILDADLTTPPEDLIKFYNALAFNRGELINGCRLVYPMERQAMRLLNLLGNKFFSWFFSYLLDQPLKDTLCGTKVLLKSDYIKIKENRSYFGNFDPFGDFDLLFGAAKLSMKITEINVRYRERECGVTQISRFKHGWLLLKMSLFAAIKLKFR